MQKYGLVFLSVLLAFVARSQTILRGTVKDVQEIGIAVVNVVATHFEDERILSFTTTDGEGNFNITLTNTVDSVYLSFTHLAYETQKILIKDYKKPVVIQLEDRISSLPEMTVKAEPIIRNGDTLVFDLAQHRIASDENLEDILSRLPGVTIGDNGAILYDGLPISKFYVEGLDLLEGKYKIITKNLKLDAVRDIEIIEHHQPIQALDSIVRPPEAAINLKLKSSIAITGTINAALGTPDLLYAGRLDLFGFQKNSQFNVLLGANNIGDQQANNFQNLYTDTKFEFELPPLSLSQLVPPLIDRSYYLLNQENLVGFNFLRKLGKTTQIKCQSEVVKDQINTIGNTDFLYVDGDQKARISQEINSLAKPLDFKQKIILEHNAKSFYLKIDAKGTLNLMNAKANNVINDLPSTEALNTQDIVFDASIASVYRWKQQAIKLNTDINYKDLDWKLLLRPTEIFTSTFSLSRFESLEQIYTSNNFDIDTYSNLFAKTENGRLSMKLGAKYATRMLLTDLIEQTGNGNELSIGKAFQNENQLNETSIYFLPSYRWYLKKNVVLFKSPLHLNWIDFDNQKERSETLFFAPTFSPSIEYIINHKSDSHFSITYQFDYNFNRANAFYDGFILSSNRNLSTSLAQLNQYQDNSINIHYKKLNVFKNLDYYVGLKISQIDYDLLQESRFNNSAIQTTQLLERNRARRLQLNSNGKLSLGSHFNLGFSGSYNLNSRVVNLNGTDRNAINQLINLRPTISYLRNKSIITLKPSYALFFNGLSKQIAHQLNYNISFLQIIKEERQLKISINSYHTITDEQIVNNFLLGAEFKQSIERIKTDFTLSLTNLTDNESFLIYDQRFFNEQFTWYQLRPRQIILKASRKL